MNACSFCTAQPATTANKGLIIILYSCTYLLSKYETYYNVTQCYVHYNRTVSVCVCINKSPASV